MGVPNISLNNGVEIPQLGFGVWQVDPDTAAEVVGTALEVGYRHIDTAQMYGNEEGVGAAIAKSGLARDEIFVTSKLNNGYQSYDDAARALDGSLAALGLEQVDLFLIHWPLATIRDFTEAWRALEQGYRDGKVRAIGVSNFAVHHLNRLLAETTVVPAVNQIELHPYLTQTELRAYGADHGIHTEAWSPLGQGGPLLADPTIAAIAAAHERTPAQVVLRWHLQLGNIVFPKSVTPARIAENFALFDFELSEEDVTAISALDRNGRIGPDPETFAYVPS